MKKEHIIRIISYFIFSAALLIDAFAVIDSTILADNVIVLQTSAGDFIISAEEWPQSIPSSVDVEEFPRQGRWFVGEDGTTVFYDKPIVRLQFLAQDIVSCGPLFFYRDSLAGRGDFLLRKF